MSLSPPNNAVLLTPALLRDWPLPQPDEGGSKEERGRILIIGGATEMPGAVMLAATAALRAGAGKLRIATVGATASLIAASIPEARVFSLPETREGDIAASAAPRLAEQAERVEALVIGPGMVDEDTVSELLKTLLPRIEKPVLVLDAAALAFVGREPQSLHHLNGNVILTPHAGEMARMLDMDKDAVTSDAAATARRAAERFGAVLSLKVSETFIEEPEGRLLLKTKGGGPDAIGHVYRRAGRQAFLQPHR